MIFPQSSNDLAAQTLAHARAARLKIATAESCTGGLIIAALTDIAGSSDVVDRGYITYSNAAKQDMLGVKNDTLQTYGAVSGQTVAEMAIGALKNSDADIAISVTGIAGPGGSDHKPEGLVWFGLVIKSRPVMVKEHLFGALGREHVRAATVAMALSWILEQSL